MASNVSVQPRADHLTELEINYELMIRRMNTDIDLEIKKRDLRRIFQEEAREGTVIPGPFNMMEEYDIIVESVDNIERRIELCTRDQALTSRDTGESLRLPVHK